MVAETDRALASTMVVALLTSLVLAMTLTPALAAWFIRGYPQEEADTSEVQINEGGFLMRRVMQVYEAAVRLALRYGWLTLLLCGLVLLLGIGIYGHLESDFLPPMDEGGFVIDYHTPWGTSLTETNRQLLQAEAILRATPDVESYSRRTGVRLALAITEPNNGDFLVKLKSTRPRKTDNVIAELRGKFHAAVPGVHWEFAGILGDLIGDLTWSPRPVEVKLFSTDIGFLEHKAPEIEAQLAKIILYQQQRESFHNLLLVLAMAIFLVFTVLLIEFHSFSEPIAIVFGAVLALFGTVLALLLTGTSLNVVSFLGAIIGVGIVAKNGILLLDFVDDLRAAGLSLQEALVRSGRRRLRPVLMTSLAAALGLLPLAYGIGSGADMLRPLAIAVIGALCISVLLSLVATPTVYCLMLRLRETHETPENQESEEGKCQD